MHSEPATVEVPTLKLPPDLLNEVSRRGKAKTDFRVESWRRPSLFGRLVEKLVGGKRRANS
jgi:hypothetical protein